MSDSIAILDFGSQTSQLIARRVREAQVYCELFPWDAPAETVLALRPKGIIEMLDLQRPIYAKTAAYGHFGRNEPEFTWEQTDKAAALKAAAGM